MHTGIREQFRLNAPLERGAYFIIGVALFIVKFNVDRLVSKMVFGRSWSFFNYLQNTWSPSIPPSSELWQTFTLLLISIPFITVGVIITLRRLRSAGLPLWLVVLIFVPLIKVLFFALLSIYPSRTERLNRVQGVTDVKGYLGLFIPRNSAAAAAMGIGVALLYTVFSAWVGTTILRDYGWSLFVGLPFIMGFISVLIYGFHGSRTRSQCLMVAANTVVLSGLGLLLVAFEGIICLIMAAPLALGMALMGGWAAYAIQRSDWWQGGSPQLFCSVFAFIPLAMATEHMTAPAASLLKVESSVEIKASPETVWKNVVTFAELPPPKEWLFRLGVAYPIRARIEGSGPGAIRRCEFSTGAFVEPIEIWDAPHLLKFSVTSNPAPLQEWTPYEDVRPPHLDGFLVSRHGQFRLLPLPGGRTLLEGTTWYQHNMWPESYWRLWSDYIIHRIHLRVLDHIKSLAEA